MSRGHVFSRDSLLGRKEIGISIDACLPPSCRVSFGVEEPPRFSGPQKQVRDAFTCHGERKAVFGTPCASSSAASRAYVSPPNRLQVGFPQGTNVFEIDALFNLIVDSASPSIHSEITENLPLLLTIGPLIQRLQPLPVLVGSRKVSLVVIAYMAEDV